MSLKAQESWPIAKLGDHIDLLTGFPFKSAEYSEAENDMRLVRGDNVAQGYLRWDGVKRWSTSKIEEYSKYFLQLGDVILAMDRPWIEAGLKYAWVTRQDLPSLLVQRVSRMRGIKGLTTEYLRYVIADPAFSDYIEPIVTGVAVPHISAAQIQSYKFRLPPLPIQRAIASILSAYDDLIENNTRRIKILEQMAQAIYREWFIEFRAPGVKLRKASIDEKKVTGKDQFPVGWEIKPVGELLSYNIGGGWGEEAESKGFPVAAYVIRGTDIPPARYASIESCPLRYHKQSNFDPRKLQVNDIVFEVSGGGKEMPVGRALLISQQLLTTFDKDVICASFCKLLRPNAEIILPQLLYLHLVDLFESRRIVQFQVQSTGIKNLKFAHFLEGEFVIVPDKKMQDKYAETALAMFDAIQTLGLKNANLRRTRDLLLPRLISGEIVVEPVAS